MRYLALCCCLSLFANDWHQWRGPNRDGSSSKLEVPHVWPKSLKEVWSSEIGASYASPVVSEDVIYTISSVGDQEIISAHGIKTGKQLWKHSYAVDFKANPYATKYKNGPFATPLVAGSQLVTVGITGKVSCFDKTTGKLQWDHQFDGLLNDDRQLFCGNTVSPLQVGDHAIVHLGNEHKGKMIAFNLKDGKQAWSWDGDLPGYVSPALMTLNGKQQLVTLTQNTVAGLDPQLGKSLWSFPYQVKWRENIVSPLVYDDKVIVSGREQGATTSLNVSNADAISKVWENKDTFMYISSPILIGDRMIGLAAKRKGTFFAMNPKTGDVHWESEGRGGMNMSFVHNGRHVLALNESGRVIAFDGKADTFKILATYELGKEVTYGHPVPVDKGLIIQVGDRLKRFHF